MRNTKPFTLMQHDKQNSKVRELRDSEFAPIAGGMSALPKFCATLTSECNEDYCDTKNDS